MRKYIASKRQRMIIGLVSAVLVVALVLMLYWFIGHKNEDTETYIYMMAGPVAVIIILISYIKGFFDDPILGRVSFDAHGVYFYTPINTIMITYSECKEIGFTRWVGASVLHNQQYSYYIYLSKIHLTDEQRKKLFWRRSKKKDGTDKPAYLLEFALFQYTPEVFADFIKCVPEPFRSKLIEEENQLNLTPREKRLNS